MGDSCLRLTHRLTFSSWIHAQFIAVDANFKLKLKNRKIEDPELGSGWSYFAENSKYVGHVAKSPDEQDVRVIKPSRNQPNTD